MLQKSNPFKKLWHFVLAIILLSAPITFLFVDPSSSFTEYLIGFIWSFTITATQWIGHVYINNRISEKMDWISHPWKRAFIGTFFILIYAVVAFLAVQIMMYYLVLHRLPHNLLNWMFHSSLYSVSIAFGASFFFTTIGFFKAWKKSLLEAEQLKVEMLAYKYEALQNQINPHFLFNSFNVLSDLVYTDQKMAVRFINQLSGLFRYVLDSRDKDLVPLKNELEFLDAYIYLLKTRFNDKFNIQVTIKPEPDEMIVPMALQLLVENAVKHNEISDEKPLLVTLKKEVDFIEVKNNRQTKQVGEASKKMGLKNIEQQFGYFTDKPIQIIPSETEFLVRLPLLKIQKT
jgi:sensor histidine kinase YesM